MSDFRNQQCKPKNASVDDDDEQHEKVREEVNILCANQLLERHCQGDFCGFDIHIYTSPESDLNDVCDPTIERFVARQTLTKTTRLIEQETVETFKATKGVDQINDHRNDVFTSTSSRETAPFYELPLNTLTQARKEKYLVDNLLLRYRQGEQNPEYLSRPQDETHLIPIGSIPGHNYYTPVRLCQTCYLIYNLIQKARINSISKERETKLIEQSVIVGAVSSISKCENERNAAVRDLDILKDVGSVLARSLLAIRCIEKSDIYEVRSFSKPPAAVLMSVSALFVLLRGKGYAWDAARRALSNADQIFQEMSCLTPNKLRRDQFDELERYTRNPVFRPENILSISKAAAKISAWVLGMSNGFNWQNGWFVHGKLDPLVNFPAFAVALQLKVKFSGDQEKNWSDEMDSRRLKSASQQRKDTKCNSKAEHSSIPKAVGNKVAKSGRSQQSSSRRRTALFQQHSVERLSGRKDIRMERKPLSISKVFTSSTGVTHIPYEVLSSPEKINATTYFIVCHDIFDTLDATKLLFYSLVRDRPTCKVLLFNYPGQAGTDFLRQTEQTIEKPSTLKNEPAINNDFLAALLNELLMHVSSEKEFTFKNGSCYLVGFGIGVPVALSFGLLFGRTFEYRKTLKAIVSINGCIHVDTHLASVLHSSLNLFRSLPESRPDLPVSFFTRFLFSDRYINSVTMNLALNIYTAVINPISLDGRIQLCNGALKNRDLRHDIETLDYPIIALQSTENCFIQPSNTDALMNQRKVSHIWSRDLLVSASEQESCYSKSSLSLISNTLMTKKGGLVISVCTGHALVQECKRVLTDTFSFLADEVKCDTQGSQMEVSNQQNVVEKDKMSAKLVKINEVLHEAGEIIGSNVYAVKDGVEKYYPKAFIDNESVVKINSAGESGDRQCGVKETQTFKGIENLEKIKFLHKAGKKIKLNEFQGDKKIVDNARVTSILQDEYLKSITDDFVKYDNDSSSVTGSSMDLNDNKVSGGAWNGNLSDSSLQRWLSEDCDSASEPLSQKSISLSDNPTETCRPEIESTHTIGRSHEESSHHIFSFESSKGSPLEKISKPSFSGKSKTHAGDEKNIAGDDAELSKDSFDFCLSTQHSDSVMTGCSFSNQYSKSKEGHSRRVKLGEAIRLYLETGLPWDLSPSFHSVETIIRQIKISPLYDSGGGPDVALAYTPPTYDELLSQAARELENEQARERIIIENVKEKKLERKQAQVAAERLTQAMEEERIREGSEQMCLPADRTTCALNFRKSHASHFENANHIMLVHSDANYKQDAANRETIDEQMSRRIQKRTRGHLDRCKYKDMKRLQEHLNQMIELSTILQRYVRGKSSLRDVNAIKKQEVVRLVKVQIAQNLQRLWRELEGRHRPTFITQTKAAITIQARFLSVKAKRERDAIRHLDWTCASLIERQWRRANSYRVLRKLTLVREAVTSIQSVVRGFVDRNIAARMRKWDSTEPGPDRVNLGSEIVKETRREFDRQRRELDHVKGCKEMAECQYSNICEGLKQSELELATLKHEVSNLETEEGFNIRSVSCKYRQSNDERGSYERRRRYIEVELSTILADVEQKKNALTKLELAIASIDEDRGLKERELKRVEENLMKLLHDQKIELDQLRKRGIALETATATSAAAAEMTARKAQEHEKQTSAMFSRQEELLKFQFMSMSLSYLSSVRMLKDMRTMNTDTTGAAIASSAETASAAAAAAVAAYIPPNREKGIRTSMDDLDRKVITDAPATQEKGDVVFIPNEVPETTKEKISELPTECRIWTITHVSSWLQGLSLGKYVRSFEEACVDGELLLDLSEEDLTFALGVEHKLHRKKIMLARDKLINSLGVDAAERTEITPSVEEKQLLDAGDKVVLVAGDEPDVRTVFSHLRHRRTVPLEKSLESGFEINTKDEQGNTLLMVAVQNSNANMVEFLLRRGSWINDANSNGNTALHFALAYDTTGQLAEFLIGNGADDTIENNLGLTPYDGLGLEENKMTQAATDDYDDVVQNTNTTRANNSLSSLLEYQNRIRGKQSAQQATDDDNEG